MKPSLSVYSFFCFHKRAPFADDGFVWWHAATEETTTLYRPEIFRPRYNAFPHRKHHRENKHRLSRQTSMLDRQTSMLDTTGTYIRYAGRVPFDGIAHHIFYQN